jgi:hypothetical protein
MNGPSQHLLPKFYTEAISTRQYTSHSEIQEVLNLLVSRTRARVKFLRHNASDPQELWLEWYQYMILELVSQPSPANRLMTFANK